MNTYSWNQKITYSFFSLFGKRNIDLKQSTFALGQLELPKFFLFAVTIKKEYVRGFIYGHLRNTKFSRVTVFLFSVYKLLVSTV